MLKYLRMRERIQGKDYFKRSCCHSDIPPKGVTTKMKALDEYILMVLFVLLLKRVNILGSET